MTIRRACIAFVLAHLGGCAEVNWSRAFYDGLRSNAENTCRLHQKLSASSCPTSMAYEEYEKERIGVQGMGVSEVAPVTGSVEP